MPVEFNMQKELKYHKVRLKELPKFILLTYYGMDVDLKSLCSIKLISLYAFMSIQFKISITKDIIDSAKHCDAENDIDEMGRNCAVAFALKDIFPNVYVTNYLIFPFGIDSNDENDLKIPLPVIAQQFIRLFDSFRLIPHLRLLLPEFEFTIDIPAEVINAINIDEIKELISNDSSNIVQVNNCGHR